MFIIKKINSINILCIKTAIAFSIFREKIKISFEKIALTPRQKSIRALEIFRVQKLILNATS